LSTLNSFVLPYTFVPDEGEPPPPIVEVDIRGPAGAAPYACLMDSGANHSALPASSIEDFAIPAENLVATRVRTAAGFRPGLALSRSDLLTVEINGEGIPIQPYFLLDRDELTGEEWEEHDPVLGRDFFLGFEEVVFLQGTQEVHLRR
jgi:hypothetical protein